MTDGVLRHLDIAEFPAGEVAITNSSHKGKVEDTV